jgi:hypothetical protein
MQSRYVVLFVLLVCVCAANAWAAVDATAYCKYQRSDMSWSKEYRLSVTFLSGSELNERTGRYSYSIASLYVVAWFGQGQAAVIRTNSFASGEVKSVFGMYFDGRDQDGDRWKIRKSY